jgi:hypothetical protein
VELRGDKRRIEYNRKKENKKNNTKIVRRQDNHKTREVTGAAPSTPSNPQLVLAAAYVVCLCNPSSLVKRENGGIRNEYRLRKGVGRGKEMEEGGVC